MSPLFAGLFRRPAGRLSRRIVFWVFVSVVVIEAIILIPSYDRRKQELLSQLREVSSAKISVVMQMTGPEVSAVELLDQIRRLSLDPIILGGALYQSDGRNVGMFGEQPELSFADGKSGGAIDLQSKNGFRYDSAWSAAELQRDYTLILRHDGSPVKSELHAFVLRISGLVLIISLFVTAGAWIALRPIVVTPIIRLRNDLTSAGEAISKDRETPEFDSASIQRQDELGEVIAAFRHMYQQISDAISKRKRAEEALQESLSHVEAYSQALNDELEKGREMQTNFLPGQLLRKPGWEIVAYFKPAHQVAGDFYDVFELPGGYVGLVIADVCDKGVGAALFMALFRSLIRIFSGQTSLQGLVCSTSEDSANLLSLAADGQTAEASHIDALKAVWLTNNYIAQNHGELAMFATLFFAVLDPSTGLLAYISGGHEPLVIVDSSGGVRENLNPTGPAVGITPDTKFEIQQTRLEPGDILLGYTDGLLGYTDGLLEAIAASGEFFTRKRLLSMLEPSAPSATVLLDQIVGRVTAHIGEADQYDDITILAVRRDPTTEGGRTS
jgi:serine phosphatase RsbU (regulator of sigma subunit)